MSYFKWLYNGIRAIRKDELGLLWFFIKAIGGAMLTMFSCVLIAFTIFTNDVIALIFALIFGVFFGITWVLYNMEKTVE